MGYCQKERLMRYPVNYKKSQTRRAWNLNRYYKITINQYDTLWANQDYSCAICHRQRGSNEPPFQVDHCHRTNQIRGILCRNCNVGIGHFRDNALILKNAIKYLNKFEDRRYSA